LTKPGREVIAGTATADDYIVEIAADQEVIVELVPIDMPIVMWIAFEAMTLH